MNRVPIGATIGASFSYIGVAWRQAWLAMAFLVGLRALVGIIRLTSPQAAGIVATVAFIPLLAFGTVAIGALYRVGFGGRASDPEFRLGSGGVQWTALEWRVLGGNIIVGLILGVIGSIFVVAWAIALGVASAGHLEQLPAVTQAGDTTERLQAIARLMLGPAGPATAVIFLVAAALLLWLNAKLGLFVIVAADTKSFDMGAAWAMTRGATWALIVTAVVIYIVEAILGFAFGLLGGAVAAAAGHASLGAATGRLFGGVVSAAISTPLIVGMQVAVYRARRPGAPEAVAAAFT